MKHTKKMQTLLERMAGIERMERGKLCRMGGRPHYNHQSWQDGNNVVRYVPAREKDFLQDAIDGYRKFTKLAQQYADEVIQQTRRERNKAFSKARPPQKTKSPQNEKSQS